MDSHTKLRGCVVSEELKVWQIREAYVHNTST